MAGVEEDVEAWGVGGRLEEKLLQKPGRSRDRENGAIKAGGQANAPTSGRGGRRARIRPKAVRGTSQVAKDVVGHDTVDHRSSAEERGIHDWKSLKAKPRKMID
ncbi:hypothetical protein CRENBAI_005768 [Crenichthys baileyi]|uniref:Uncharacterized protein n=1 Tax=Crenichthys baileyi TaxID=28760 RepID=A0AAV9SF44_9TELE